jgi:hypothetical protein
MESFLYALSLLWRNQKAACCQIIDGVLEEGKDAASCLKVPWTISTTIKVNLSPLPVRGFLSKDGSHNQHPAKLRDYIGIAWRVDGGIID